MNRNMNLVENETVFGTDRIAESADYYWTKYRPFFEDLEKHSPLSKFRGVTEFDYYALGEQLRQFENYRDYVNEAGTASDLGKLPNVALDIITASYGTSIIPHIASVQPIDEEIGTIYFKTTRAVHSKGNVTAGDTLRSPRSVPDVYPDGYASENILNETLATTVSGVTEYTGTLANYPIRPNTVFVSVPLSGGTLSGRSMDNPDSDNNVDIAGVGFSGTLNCTTGVYTINLNSDPGEAVDMTISYGLDYESGAQIPMINPVNTYDQIRAQIFVLGSEVGMFKAYSMKKRFGQLAENDMITDLTNEITAEIGNTLINTLIAALPGTSGSSVEWNRNPAWVSTTTNPIPGVSWNDHKMELKDVIARRSSQILTQAGRGAVNFLIAGPTAAGYLSNLPGFVSQHVNAQGPHIYGTLDGMTVIRAPQVSDNDIYCIYRGSGFFDVPIVYSPYMPLFVQGSLPTPDNLIKKSGVAAVWAGIKAVNPAFITRVRITEAL